MKRCLLALWCCLGASLAHAQQLPVEVTGTIVGIEGIRISIKDNAGNLFLADVTQVWVGPDGVGHKMPAAPSIIITGTEDPKSLRVGQAIQFSVTLAGKRLAVGEVTEATLITATPDARMGILTADPVEEAAAEEGEKKKPTSNHERCLVAGVITKAKSGVITIAAQNLKPLTVRLADNAVITVSGSDLSIARPGDKITASGQAIRPPLFIAQSVKIEHSPPSTDRPAPVRKPKPGIAKPGAKGAAEDPFALGDPSDAPADAADVATKKPKVKLELIKTN